MSIIQNLAAILAAKYGRDVRQAIHDSIYDIDADVTAFEVAYQGSLNTAGLVLTEVVNARSGAGSLKARIDVVDAIADSAMLKADAMASGSPKGRYATLIALEAALPIGDTGAYLVEANSHLYFWDTVTSAWIDGGAYGVASASQVSITDVNERFISPTVEGALQEVGAQLAETPTQIDIRNNKSRVKRLLNNTDKPSYYCRAYNNANQLVGNQFIFTVIAFNTIVKDTNNFHSNLDDKFYIYKNGFYSICTQIEFASGSGASTRGIEIKLNGTIILAVSEESIDAPRTADVTVSTLYYLEKGDYIQVLVRQNSDNNLYIYAGDASNQHPFYCAICMVSQPESESANYEYRGIANVFKDKFKNLSDMGSMIEYTAIVDDQQVDAWFGSGVLYHAYSTDKNAVIWTKDATACIASCRFQDTFKYLNKYYTIGTMQPTYDLFLWESDDKVNWTIMNGGNPIITHSAGIWSYLWNCSVTVVGDTWNVWVEAGSLESQADVGLNYTHGTLSNLSSFNANKSPNQVVNGGGNPSCVYIPDRNAILILHGSIFAVDDLTAEKNYWTVRASYVYLSNDLSIANNYVKTTKEQFYIYQANVHICDPAIVELPSSKTSKLLLKYSYGQTSLYQTYADVSMLELFDSLT